MAAGTVPDDLILGILAKLRLKSLLRFKCLSKTWYSTISDPQFSTKLHWMRPSVLICQDSKKFSTTTIESLLTAKNKTPTPLSPPWETTEDINPLPFEALPLLVEPGSYLIGSCNGLVCVDHISSKSGGGSDLILWNPSTGKFRRLPRRPRSRLWDEDCYHYYVWFGYDESIHDYKLVCVDYHRFNPKQTKLNVFTLKSNAWRTTYDCRFPPDGRRLCKVDDLHNPIIIGVHSNGAIHWRTYIPSDDQIVIVALDLATENFQVLDFANYPFHPRVGGGSCLAGGCPCRLAEMSLQIVKEYGRQGMVLPNNRENMKYYPILLSSEKEILAVFDRVCREHKGTTIDDRIIKFRIEEGGEKVSSPETLLFVEDGYPCRNNIVLHMEGSLVSLTHFTYRST